MNIPFTHEQFFRIIEQYNASLFPAQLIILILGLMALFILHSSTSSKNRIIMAFPGILWI